MGLHTLTLLSYLPRDRLFEKWQALLDLFHISHPGLGRFLARGG
jgi:hypothetical protein